MIKPINALLLVFMFVAGSAQAEWVELGETTSATIYIDKTKKYGKQGISVRFGKFTTTRLKNEMGAMSVRSRIEIDCKQWRYRPISFSAFSESMLRGTMLHTDNLPDSEWMDAPPNTPAPWQLQ
jgi:hypothetical protein